MTSDEQTEEDSVNSGSDIGAFIRAQRLAAEVSIRQLAERAGVSNPYLSQIERGLKKPSAEILQSLAKGLRISAEQLYVQAGILDEVGEAETAQHVERGLHRLTRAVGVLGHVEQLEGEAGEERDPQHPHGLFAVRVGDPLDRGRGAVLTAEDLERRQASHGVGEARGECRRALLALAADDDRRAW